MPDLIVDHVSKRYTVRRLSGGRTLGQRLRGLRNRSDEFWALRDVSFEVERGETLGIIGHNGAGKSTILKLLSSVTAPTSGVIRIEGRLSALIEVGSGFHPELTGRENIYLSGSILGMRRREIAGKLERIIEFAGVGDFIDTPVKHYSSGMLLGRPVPQPGVRADRLHQADDLAEQQGGMVLRAEHPPAAPHGGRCR